MNLSALKTFAPEVRRQLLEAVGRKLDYVLSADTADLRAASAQVEMLRDQAATDRSALIERVTYTWFNRLAALRFIDARGWHPFRARVITAVNAEETQPELLRLTRAGNLPTELLPFTDPERLNNLLDGHLPSSDPQGEVYRDLLLAACRFYHDLMPFLFEALDDETELLLPDDLLTDHSIAHGFRTEISDEDCSEVELLGWLYQFYISEKKDQVMARKSAVPSEDIPAVTQLFTPHWIVRYLVENSLGRLWLLNRPGSRLRDHMPYYIESGTDSSSEASAKEDFLRITKPEEIRMCDPAVGSGHMLTYSFDLLTLIYEEEGYAPSEIPALILRHNLYGLDICPRAAQLAELALVLKARGKSRRFFQPENIVQPNIIELRDVRFTENELRDYSKALGLDDLFNPTLLKLLHQFEEAKNVGSLIQPCLDERSIVDVRHSFEVLNLIDKHYLRETQHKILHLFDQARALTQRYHVVVANPPYMGNKAQSKPLKQHLEQSFPSGKSDLFAAFVLRNLKLALPNGHLGFMTPFTWMFITTYSELRKEILTNVWLQSLIQPEYHSFFDSAFVPICSFVIRSMQSFAPSVFIDLSEHYGSDSQSIKALEAIQDTKCPWRHKVPSSVFLTIPGSPIAFNLSPKLLNTFGDFPSLGELVPVKEGLNTGDNERFLRLWHEVSHGQICLHRPPDTDYRSESFLVRWFPCNKGGPFRRWYGNNEYVIDWKNDGTGIKEFRDQNGKQLAALRNLQFLFKQGLTWSGVSLAGFSAREFPHGFTFNSVGRSLFTTALNHKWLLGALNSVVSFKVFKVLAPTMSVTVGVVASLPIPPSTESMLSKVTPIIDGASNLMHLDWDYFESSWDFGDLPLLRPGLKGSTLEASWRNWEAQSTAAICRMQELETENNRLFITAYGLEDELKPEVPEEQITLARADARRDMASFLSYAVGCMMGRYSLDHPGLILANAGDSLNEFLAKVGRTLDQLTFAPDDDGIIPVLSGEWFEDDIVARTRDFLRATFGEATLEANIRFIEESLGKDLRKYFLTDFYKDHLQTYKKRPIYWLFQSPKKGFSALVYLHRYTKDTPNRVLSGYLREFLHKLRTRQDYLAHIMISESTPPREITKARKESEQNAKTIRECEEYEREILLPLAQRRIELDLDDGVKVNYLKLGAALATIPGLAVQEE